MNFKLKKAWIPTIISIVLFAIVAIIYFSPSLEGYTLRQGDITNNKGMSKEVSDFRKLFDEEAVWTNSMFGGMPTYQTSISYSSGYTFIKSGLAKLLFGGPAFLLFVAFISFFTLLKTLKTNTILSFLGGLAYGLSTYNILILEAGHNTKMHAIGSIPLALAFLIQFLRRKNNSYLYAGLFGLTFGYQLFCNHLQMTYYFAFVFAAIYLAEGINYFKEHNIGLFIKKTGVLIAVSILAICTNFANIYNTKAFAEYTMRGKAVIDIEPNGESNKQNFTKSGLKKDYITQWSYGIGETYNLLVPNAKGNSRHLTKEFFDYLKTDHSSSYNSAVQIYRQSNGQLFKGYWGNQPFTSGPNYIGAILVFLALLYLFTIHTPLKWALLGASILALTLAWGRNFMWLTDLFIDYFPLYNKFRTVSSFLVVLNLTIPLMAFLFINKLTTDSEFRKNNNILKLGLIIIGSIVAIGFLPLGFDFISQNEKLLVERVNNVELEKLYELLIEFRKSLFLSESLFTALQMGGALLLIYLFSQSKIKSQVLQILIASFVVFNLWSTDKQFLNNQKTGSKYNSWSKLAPGNAEVRMSQGDLDIYKLETKNKPEIIKTVNSKIKNFKKQEGRRITPSDKESIMFSTLGFNSNYRVLNLNDPFNNALVAYFHKSTGGYSPAKLRRFQDIIDFYIQPELKLLNSDPSKMKALNMLNTKYYLKDGKLAYTNPHAYGNAWYVEHVNYVNSNNNEILEIKNINPKTSVVIHDEFKDIVTKSDYNSSGNTIKLTDYLPNHLVYEANNKTEGLAVFSEIYYADGWNAYIDGKLVKHSRANYILRALIIPSGKHKVEFKFEPKMFAIGNIINVVSILILISIIGFLLFKRKQQEA